MEISATCPICNTTKTIKYNLPLYICLWLTIIGGIIYSIIIIHRFKCPKCKQIMENNNTIQTPKDQFFEIQRIKKQLKKQQKQDKKK